MASPRPVPLWDKLRGISIALQGVAYSIVQLILGRGIKSKPRAKRFVYALIRYVANNTSTAGDYALGYPGSEGRYLEFCRKKGFQPDTVVLDHGAKAHWLGGRDAERIIVWFHGGGFALPLTAGHLTWLHRWSQSLSKQKSTSAVMLNYTLVPEARYPTPIKQAAALLNYLLTEGGKRPDQIIIGGDSAGGNMTLGLLSHILHPHPQIPDKINLSGPLAGACLVSPWVNFTKTDAAFQANLDKDIIGSSVGDRWGPNYRGDHTDNYIEAVYAEPEWFQGIDRAVSNIWVWAGSAEVLVGSITNIAENLTKVHPRVDYFIEEDAIHIAFFLDAEHFPIEDTVSTKKLEQWFGSV
ncbi:alpha/beta-hydrolase [Myriangium duriaei CBS 260.36]|uniref:Alpha/beta-hydrolase n=1 Tax=Myriangium duriaei CBS 260.36 TaxID=1168546 RepID=A0A9P4J9E0_9PEZI|nr:alpha/beta-hydrolase [Myriangium duriaei CBS 260.36]